MSNRSTRRAVKRSLASYRVIGDRPTRPIQARRERMERSPYGVTKRHIKMSSRFAWREPIKTAHDDEVKNRRVVEFIEAYETYRLRNRHTKRVSMSMSEYLRAFYRRNKAYSAQVIDDIRAWYREHEDDHIQRLRKQHAIVGTEQRPILRTA